MNIENNFFQQSTFYKTENGKLVFQPCHPKERCSKLSEKVVEIKIIIEKYLSLDTKYHKQQALNVSQKVFELSQLIPNHEISCQVIKYKHVLIDLYYYLYEYYLGKRDKKWLVDKCEQTFKKYDNYQNDNSLTIIDLHRDINSIG
jgi:hypothetical protein